MRIIKVFPFVLFFIFLYSCVPDEIILPGDISGYVTDAETTDPVESASVVLSTFNIEPVTFITGSNGIFEFENIAPAFYQIDVSKPGYKNSTRNVSVASRKLVYTAFPLTGTQYPNFSDSLIDFGIDSIIKTFTIKNIGKDVLKYYVETTQDWITVDPHQGDVITETDTITVTIDKAKLPRNKIKESIIILCSEGESYHDYYIDVLANGIFYKGYYYGIVNIGTQTWFAENLNTGNWIRHYNGEEPSDNDVIERFCYEDDPANCITYGGIYSWREMMDYGSSDTGMIGTTQGICPEGWHIPTLGEWLTLFDFIGGYYIEENTFIAGTGGTLKAEGTKEEGTGLWLPPNEGATDAYGFTALPSGYRDYNTGFGGIEGYGCIWSSTKRGVTDHAYSFEVISPSTSAFLEYYPTSQFGNTGRPVRCIKDP